MGERSERHKSVTVDIVFSNLFRHRTELVMSMSKRLLSKTLIIYIYNIYPSTTNYLYFFSYSNVPIFVTPIKHTETENDRETKICNYADKHAVKSCFCLLEPKHCLVTRLIWQAALHLHQGQ